MAKKARKRKTSKKRPMKRKRSTTRKRLSFDCRCDCASVSTIAGPATVAAGGSGRFTLAISLARNRGCRPGAGCRRTDRNPWSLNVAGVRGGNVTLRAPRQTSVMVDVAAGARGRFQLIAAPKHSCNCVGRRRVVVNCVDRPDQVTIPIA